MVQRYFKAAKKIYDLGKRYLPNASKAEQQAFKEKVSDLQVDMSHDSAVSLALKDFQKIKPKGKNTGGLSGGVKSGPPPKKGPNPQGLKNGGCPYRTSNNKNKYPGHNGIQIKGHKFSGVR